MNDHTTQKQRPIKKHTRNTSRVVRRVNRAVQVKETWKVVLNSLESHANRNASGFRQTIFKHLCQMYKRRSYLGPYRWMSSKYDTNCLMVGVERVTRKEMGNYLATGKVTPVTPQVTKLEHLKEVRNYFLVNMPFPESNAQDPKNPVEMDEGMQDQINVDELERLLQNYARWRLEYMSRKSFRGGYGSKVSKDEELPRVSKTARRISQHLVDEGDENMGAE